MGQVDTCKIRGPITVIPVIAKSIRSHLRLSHALHRRHDRSDNPMNAERTGRRAIDGVVLAGVLLAIQNALPRHTQNMLASSGERAPIRRGLSDPRCNWIGLTR